MCIHVIFKATEHANYYVHEDLKDIFQFPKRIQNILVINLLFSCYLDKTKYRL